MAVCTYATAAVTAREQRVAKESSGFTGLNEQRPLQRQSRGSVEANLRHRNKNYIPSVHTRPSTAARRRARGRGLSMVGAGDGMAASRRDKDSGEEKHPDETV